MFRRNLLVVVLLFLVGVTQIGCSTFSRMEAGLNALKHRPIKVAFNVLGYPSGKQEFSGDTVYIWNTASSGTIMMPRTSTSYGYVGTTPISVQTTQYQPVNYNYSCTVKLITDAADIIKTWGYNGNVGGCSYYSDRLGEFADLVAETIKSESSEAVEQARSRTSAEPAKISCETDCKNMYESGELKVGETFNSCIASLCK